MSIDGSVLRRGVCLHVAVIRVIHIQYKSRPGTPFFEYIPETVLTENKEITGTFAKFLEEMRAVFDMIQVRVFSRNGSFLLGLFAIDF